MAYHDYEKTPKLAITFKIRLDEAHNEADLKAYNSFCTRMHIDSESVELISEPEPCWCIFIYYHEPKQPKRSVGDFRRLSSLYEPEEYETLIQRADAITEWKNAKAKEMNIPANYIKLSPKAIDLLAETCPTSLSELNNLGGVNRTIKDDFGEELLALLKSM